MLEILWCLIFTLLIILLGGGKNEIYPIFTKHVLFLPQIKG